MSGERILAARARKLATAVAGVAVLMALTGLVATCGGPAAYAREDPAGGGAEPASAAEARGFNFSLDAKLRIADPDARVVHLPVRVLGYLPGAEVLEVEVTDPETARGDSVVGRTAGPVSLKPDPGKRGRFCTTIQVPIDLQALNIADGQSRKVRVKARVARGAPEGASGDAAGSSAEGRGGTELDTLIAEARIAVSALPSPSGDWYPGDAHFHSTVSDGALTLSETLAEAKNTYGMKWLVVTDHWKSSGGMGGVLAYPSTSGAVAGFPSYYDAVMRLGVQYALPVGPACEWSSAKNAIPGSGSHVLGLGMSRATNATFPAMFTESRQSLVDKLNAHNVTAFTVAAHPVGTQVNGMYVWDWKVARNDGIELFTDMRALHETIRTNWFARLRSELSTVVAKGPSGNFTVGIATSDGHANGWTVVAGGASMTWLWLPSGERTLPSPGNVSAVWKRLRLGNAVASGDGDFARPTVTAAVGGVSAKAGPGELVRSSAGSSVTMGVTYASRTGHRLKSIDVWRGDSGGVAKSGTWAVDAVSGTKSITLPAPARHCFYVMVAHFYDTASLNTTPKDVVANPVWVKVE